MSRTSNDLEVLLQSVVFEGVSDARDLKVLFQNVVSQLTSAGILFAVIGRLALNRYRKAQFTDQILLVVTGIDDAQQPAFRSFYKGQNNTSRGRGSSVELEIIFTVNELEGNLISATESIHWMGSFVKVAEPEYLVLNMLKSGALADDADTIYLIGMGWIDFPKARAMISQVNLNLLEAFELAASKAKQEAGSSYSKRVEQRLAERELARKNAVMCN